MIQSIVSSSFFKTFRRTQSIMLLLFVCLAVIPDVPSMLHPVLHFEWKYNILINVQRTFSLVIEEISILTRCEI